MQTEYIEAARLVLGGIDLDPASSNIASANIAATRAISRAAMERTVDMEQTEFDRMMMCGAARALAAEMLTKGLITQKEYGKIERHIERNYHAKRTRKNAEKP